MVVKGVLLHLSLKIGSCLLSLEQGKLGVIKQNPVTSQRQDFKLISAEVNLVAQMVLVVSSFIRLLCRWRCVQNLTNGLTLLLLLPAFFLLGKPRRVKLHFLGVQVSIHADQLGYTLFDLIPVQGNAGIVLPEASLQGDSLAIVLLVNSSTNYDGIGAAPTVLIFEKIDIFLCGQALLKLLIDSHFPLRDTAPTSENSVDDLL